MKKFVLLIAISGTFFSISNAQINESSELRSRDWNYLWTDHGHIRFGPANKNFAHIYTESPRFIFNKDIYSYFGGFSAYDKFNLNLKTNGTSRLTIMSSNGFVGIATKNPEARLDVNGNVKVKTDLNVLGNSIVGQNMSVNQALEVKGGLSLHNLDTTATPKSSQFLVINSNGLVQSLTLNDFVGNLYKVPSSCIADIEGNFPPAIWSNNNSSTNPKLFTGSDCPVRVGIGTAEPLAKLHVKGNAKISMGLEVGDASFEDSKLTVRSDAIFDKSVAIGTEVQDGYDLAVCGKIRATEVKVNVASEWCDYVFEEDYKLRDLSEVDAFIKENKHLPEIPSAEVVDKEGIAVSEMLILMMKKIEELTLYTIEQEKRIKELEIK